ncbi:hypothetical protein [Brucella pseudintermedia]|uniref:hypothetical protein n=1 Tax=Brucella pseudintermedia TaxID=370111 RepID=UPI00158961E5|nr:hypothetical protein [Brucella pseudintermedia]
MKKARIDMRLVTPRAEAKPSILKEQEAPVQSAAASLRPYRRTATFSLSEEVLMLLKQVKYETGQNYNQIIEEALRRAYSE